MFSPRAMLVVALLGLTALLVVPLPSGAAPPTLTAPHPVVVSHRAQHLGAIAPPEAIAGIHPLGQHEIDVGRILGAETATSGAPTAVPPSKVTVHPRTLSASGPLVTGTSVDGYVLDSTYATAVSGVSVTASPAAGGLCGSGCVAVTTDSSGYFSAPAPIGAVRVTFDVDYYLSNATWATTRNGSPTHLGNVYLVHDGWVSGVVESNNATPGPVNATISTASRDGLVIGSPSGGTAPNGSFVVAVPPLPSTVTFAPPFGAPYLANQTYVNATPYGTVDVGIVRLEGGVTVTATLRDRVTGALVPASDPSELVFCTRRTSYCTPDSHVAGPYVSAIGLPGPAYVRAFAVGYIVNSTPIPDVPFANNGTDDLGTIFVLPMGAVNLTSAFTGGPPPNTLWASGNVTVYVCSMTGEDIAVPTVPPSPHLTTAECWGGPNEIPGTDQNALPIGAAGEVLGPPLQDAVYVVPGSEFPVATISVPSTGYWADFPRFFGNLSWANVTPDQATPLGFVNLTVGDYLSGNVVVLGSSGGPVTTSVSVCSTDVTNECGGGSPGAATPSGCPTGGGPGSFCVPAPPGPVRITATAYGFGENHTWFAVPKGCCAQEGTSLAVGTINVTIGLAIANVTGHAWVTNPPLPFLHEPLGGLSASVDVCHVGPIATVYFGPNCFSTLVNVSTGAFNLTALAGWNSVTIIGAGYEVNRTWVDLIATNDTGVIYLTPLGAVGGRIVSLSGAGLYAASVEACAVPSILHCVPIGSGITGTSGEFNGTISGGPLPRGQYEILASAAGYQSNWAWVNVTAGNFTAVPTIRLPPVGLVPSGSGRSAASPPSTGTPTAAWIDGRVIDTATDLGVPNIDVNACRVGGGGCLVLPDPTGFGGNYNGSLSSGQWELYLNATGYDPGTLFVNLTGVSYRHLGRSSLTPWPWVRGRAVIGPWPSLYASGMGPNRAYARGCDRTGTECGAGMFVSTDGLYNLSAPRGTLDSITFNGTGLSIAGSTGAGYDSTAITINASSAYIDLVAGGAAPATLSVFGAWVGDVRDGSAWVGTTATVNPVAFPSITALGNGPSPSFVSYQAGPGGRFLVFSPVDSTSTFIKASTVSYRGANETVIGPVPASALLAAPNLTLSHFGWVTLRVVDSATSIAIAYASISVTLADPANATVIRTQEATNGLGIANVTAPASLFDNLTVGAPGFSNQTMPVTVLESATTRLGLLNLSASTGGGGTFFRSEGLNGSGSPPLTTVLDAASHQPVPGVAVQVTGSNGGVSTTGVATNGLGQFLTFAPPDPSDTLHLTHLGYVPFAATFPTGASPSVVLKRINLTGDGVVAGRVVVEPSGAPGAFLTVMLCPNGAPVCLDQTTTNASGGFWIDAPPGIDVVSVLTDAYLANETATVNVSSDAFLTVGAIDVFGFANIHGSIRALPSGGVLVGANASVCSPLGYPTGPCFTSVYTDANGTFLLPVPPGHYVLAFRDAGFNTTYLAVFVSPGEQLDVGTIFLLSDGLLYGTVVGAPNDTAISGASLLACAAWLGGGCFGPTTTDANGSFVLVTDPGPVTLTVSASGYIDAYESFTTVPARSTEVPPIVLQPIPTSMPESVSGRVVITGTSIGVYPGVVVAFAAGTPAASGGTDVNGAFSLVVPYGSYQLQASSPGYRPTAVPIVAHGPVIGIVLNLSPMTYELSGTVVDSASHLPVGGVRITEGGAVLGVTNSLGGYATTLTNGTHELTATPPGGIADDPLSFTVQVNGRSVVRDLFLNPTGSLVLVHVFDAASGLPISGALVSLNSSGIGAPAVVREGSTDANGNFSARLPAGVYTVSVLAGGYPIVIGTSTIPPPGPGATEFVIPVAVGGVASAAGPGGGLPIPLFVAILAAIGVAAFLGAYFVLRRRPPVVETTTFRWGATGAIGPEAEAVPYRPESDERVT